MRKYRCSLVSIIAVAMVMTSGSRRSRWLRKPERRPSPRTWRQSCVTGHFDNSATNRYNTAPNREVAWAEQGWEEMFVPFMTYSVDISEQSLARGSTQDQ